MKKGYKFNVIDAVVIIAIVGVLAFIGTKFTKSATENAVDTKQFEFSFHCDEVPNFVLEYIEEGAEVTAADNNDYFGKIVSVTKCDSAVYSPDANGKIVKSTKPDHSGVDIVVEGEGEQTGSGVKLAKGVYGVGHTIVLKAGNSKVSGKISGIKER